MLFRIDILFFVSLIFSIFAQNDLDEEFDSSTTQKPPPDPFEDNSDQVSLASKLDDLDLESQELVIDFVRNGRKLNGDLRRRLVLYVMKFSPVQNAVEISNNDEYARKIDKIKYRFRSGLKINYTSLKTNIDKLVAHLLAPIFAPFMLLEQDEIRPLLSIHQNKLNKIKSSDRFAEPVTVAPQQISNQQSSFTALELFPSSLPYDKWAQFDPRWMNPSPVQFSFPSYSPNYQPFQYYRPYYLN
ncbi:unnamed protein product [Caenorhabditis bovis]|uniref:SXP/RAL-2 family protein Ani s 5-like cation-binding domain-containing protein n=1 Tax=Caenorhabditis bovis TaxID=2654633 RepID=A0A8S1F175_9PELO|nr:unnamed protein product [Caenorhabditis bovis]